jgi:Collagen triple helix repeat (20 copies)
MFGVSWQGRRVAILTACLIAAFAATATVLSVSLATTGREAMRSSVHHAKPRGGLTKAEVVALIKQYAKSGSTGAPGPAGPAGLKGEAGANGSNGTSGEKGLTGETGARGELGAKGESGGTGTVTGYSASEPPTGLLEGVKFSEATEGSPAVVLTKALPAGSFMASGKVNIGIAATAPGGEAYVECALVDTPEGGSPTSDMATFGSATTAPIPNPITTLWGAATTLPMELPVSTTVPSTLAVNCWVFFASGGENAQKEPGDFIAEASFAQIQAVQTTTNS